MAETKNRVRFWRGTAENYELLKKARALSYWTRYSVKYVDSNGLVTWKEFYGDNPLSTETGQLLPVIDIVSELPSVLNPGDRYWVSNNNENYIVEITVGADDEQGSATLDSTIKTLAEGVSVRVRERDYKSYFLMEGKYMTYDEVNCGTYDNSAV